MSLPKENTSKQMTIQDVVYALITLVVGFLLITFVPKDIPHHGIYTIIGAAFGALGPILFIVKFFRLPLKLNDNSHEEYKK